MAKSGCKATDDDAAEAQPPLPQDLKARRKKKRKGQDEESESSTKNDAALEDSPVRSSGWAEETGNPNSKLEDDAAEAQPPHPQDPKARRKKKRKGQDQESESSTKNDTAMEDSPVRSSGWAEETGNPSSKLEKKNKGRGHEASTKIAVLPDSLLQPDAAVLEETKRKTKPDKVKNLNRDKAGEADPSTNNAETRDGDNQVGHRKKKTKRSKSTSESQDQVVPAGKLADNVVLERKEPEATAKNAAAPNGDKQEGKLTKNAAAPNGDKQEGKRKKKKTKKSCVMTSETETQSGDLVLEEELEASAKNATALNGNGAEGKSKKKKKTKSSCDATSDAQTQVEVMEVETESARSQSKTLFVGNIPLPTRPDEVMGFFAKHGCKALDCMIPYHNGCSRGFGYVEFSSAEEAKKAMNSLNKEKLMGQSVTLQFAYEDICSKRKTYMSGNWGVRRSIVVKGLDKSAQKEKMRGSLEKHFSECDVLDINVLGHQDSATGIYKNEGKAILNLKDNESFMKALELDKSNLAGKKLEIIEAKVPIHGPCFLCVSCGGDGITCAKCGGPIGGRLTKLSESSQKAKVFTIVVKSLDSTFSQAQTEDYLRAHFSVYGSVARVSVPLFPGSNKIRRIAFVDFYDQEAATKAVACKNPDMFGKKLVVEPNRLQA